MFVHFHWPNELETFCGIFGFRATIELLDDEWLFPVLGIKSKFLDFFRCESFYSRLIITFDSRKAMRATIHSLFPNEIILRKRSRDAEWLEQKEVFFRTELYSDPSTDTILMASNKVKTGFTVEKIES